MLRMFTSIAAAITLSAPALAEAGPGKLAPAFNTTDITGANVSIPDLAGRMVVLENHEQCLVGELRRVLLTNNTLSCLNHR